LKLYSHRFPHKTNERSRNAVLVATICMEYPNKRPQMSKMFPVSSPCPVEPLGQFSQEDDDELLLVVTCPALRANDAERRRGAPVMGGSFVG